MKCNAKHKPQHRTHYVNCEKVPGHKGQHAAYDNGQSITWTDKDSAKPKTPDLVSIERESLEALLHAATQFNGPPEHAEAIQDAQRVLGHSLANGKPLPTAEEIIEERTRGVVLPRPSTLADSDAQRAAQNAAVERREREPTVNETKKHCTATRTDPLAWCILPSSHAGNHEWVDPNLHSAQEINEMIESRRRAPYL